MNADIVFKVHGRDPADLGRKIETIDAIARTPQEVPPGLPGEIPPLVPPAKPPAKPPAETPDPPTTRQPYFDLGDAQGKVGELVSIPMLGGCRHPVNGLHIGIGLDGYGKFEMEGFTLGEFLTDYMKAQGLIVEKVDGSGKWVDHYWSGWNMVKNDPHRALPTEWCDVVVATFSLSQKSGPTPPIQIPVDTELFTFQIRILEKAALGEHELVCKDEYFYTHSRQRRRDFLYTTDRDSEFARGGVTRIDTQGGKITVVA